jgi:hypothetical protein
MDDPHEDERARYWFPAKRYGWGWGFPCTWEGWVTLLLYFLLIGLPAFWVRDDVQVILYVIWGFAITALLIWVCWRKGERPRWRWGGD